MIAFFVQCSLIIFLDCMVVRFCYLFVIFWGSCLFLVIVVVY